MGLDAEAPAAEASLDGTGGASGPISAERITWEGVEVWWDGPATWGGRASVPAATASLSGGVPVTGTITAVAPAASASLTAGGPVSGTIAGSAPAPRAALLGASSITQGDLSPGDPGYDPGADPSDVVGETGWQVRAVRDTGGVVNLVGGVSVETVHRAINGDRWADLSIPTAHPDAEMFDLFDHEVQLWLDGDLFFWGRPARLNATAEGNSDQLAIRCDDLFSYFRDCLVGGERENHITSPHEDASEVGNTPTSWTATSGVDLWAIVDNNWEFWHAQKAIQVNNADTGEDAYIYQRFTVPAELDELPFAAAATCYISDAEAGSPAWGGPAYNERGLMIHRLDGSTFVPLSSPNVAKITDDTPRNALVRLQTEEVVAHAGEVIEVRLYAPDAWVAWRWAGLFDGRYVGVDRVDKATAVQVLAEHAQDTAVGKQDHRIGTDLVGIGERITRRWPWWRRDNVGEQIAGLADTFEFTVDTTETTRTLQVRRTIGSTHSTVLTKADFVAWGLGMEVATAHSRMIRQGDGQGVARDEWWASDSSALRGNVREGLTFGEPGETLAQLRDNARADLARTSNVARLPRARIVGELAKAIREGDTVPVNLDHGWAQFTGQARALAIDFDGAARVAWLHLEPVT